MSKYPILVVDDNPDDFYAVQRVMAQAGIGNELIHAESGDDALAMLRGEGRKNPLKPTFILMDVNMPGMKGTEVLQEIRSDDKIKSIPVIMLTSSNADRDVVSAFQGGANSYLTKPVDFSQLIQALQRIKSHEIEIALNPK